MPGMEPRVHIITLGMPDLAAARRFYVEGLGWEPTMEVPGEIVFLRVGHGLLLGLWHADVSHQLETTTYDEMKRIFDDAGLRYLEVEFLADFWVPQGEPASRLAGRAGGA